MSHMTNTLVSGWALSATLWVAVIAVANEPATRPGDEAMTCAQIASELSPYVQQMKPNIQALATTQQQLYTQGRAMGEKRKAEEAALTPLATAGALDPTGASKRAYQAAEIAQAAKEKRENEAFSNSPLAKQNKAQSEQVAAQAQQMQANTRIQQLMQLAQDKHCH